MSNNGMFQLIGSGISALGSLSGGQQDHRATERINNQNIAMQKEFAQNSIQWKVNDAKKAGLHPLYALGANTATFTPSSQVSSFGNSIAQASSHLGQGISNINFEQAKNAKLQNELLKAQIESQKLQNSSFARSMGQQSNQQNKINEALVLNAVSPKVNTKTLKDPTNIYLGKEMPQVIDDRLSDNPAHGVLVQARKLEKEAPWIFNGKKLDFLDSLLNLSPQYVDKKDATMIDKAFYKYFNLHTWLENLGKWQDKNKQKQKQRIEKRNNFIKK